MLETWRERGDMKLLQGIRPLTLPLSITPVLIGGFSALEAVRASRVRSMKELCVMGDQACRHVQHVQSQANTGFFVIWALCLAVALFMQIAANFANDYSDGVRGTDAGRTAVAGAAAGAATVASSGAAADGASSGAAGPADPADQMGQAGQTSQTNPVDQAGPAHQMSQMGQASRSGPSDQSNQSNQAGQNPSQSRGPSRLVASGTNPLHVLIASIVCAALACEAGLGVIALTGQWWFLAVGVACLLAAWFYVGGRHPYGYHGLGGVAVFVFFGVVATLGTEFALASRITAMGICGAVSAGLSACVVLGVNNMRDIDADAANGKRTLTVILGRRRAAVLMLLELLASIVALCAAVWVLKSPLGICGALLAFSMAIVCASDAKECGFPDDEEPVSVDFRAMFRHAIGLSVALAIAYALCLITM